MGLKAKCPNCNLKAEVNDEMSIVKCISCGFESSYDNYLEIMHGKAVSLSENFQYGWSN